MKVGIIDLQGSVKEHYLSLSQLIGEKNVFRISKKGKLSEVDKIIIPGGESTTLCRLLNQTGIDEEIKKADKQGKPIFGTCAGLITLAKNGGKKVEKSNQKLLGLMDISVDRNAFGRQKNSFEANLDLSFLEKPFPGVFIRAPVITDAGKDVSILGKYKNKIIACRQNNLLVTAFHPELVDDFRVYDYFLKI